MNRRSRPRLHVRYAPIAPALLALACGGSKASPPEEPPYESSVSRTSDAPPPTAGSDAAKAPPPEPAKPAPATSPNNEVTLKLLHALKGEKKNLFYSGTSLRGVLGMAALGAQGPTLDELVQALAIDANPAKNAEAAKAETEAWTRAAGSSELVVGNRLWVDKAFPLEKPFVDAAESGYGAGAVNVDFVKAAEKSRTQINAWVSETTKGKIKDLLPGGSVTPLTRLVLTNAVYFKGNWSEAFDKANTKDEPFQAPSGAVRVPTMRRTGQIGYAEVGKVRLVSLPYVESELAMLIALPGDAATMESVTTSLDAPALAEWTKAMDLKKVALSLPKFSFSWGRSVKRELQALGIRTAFTDAADFGKIAPKEKAPLSVSDVFHKSFVQVDETGTEAAAASGAVMVTRAAVSEQILEVKVDRPFLFFIRNTKTGDVLFAGRVVNPKG